MAEENFSELTTEELIKKKKTTTMVTGLLAGVLIASLVIAAFQAVKQGAKGFSLIAVTLALLPILFLSYSSIKKINEELKSRNPG
jgi:uncharacterized membrane protein